MLTTDRLLLRRWRDDDREPFAALNADPVVMEGVTEVTAHGAGVLTEWLAHADDPVAPGQPLARIGGLL